MVMVMGMDGGFHRGYYNNAVDTAGESEGSGSSGRVNAGTTASSNSTAPVRKSININSDRKDAFGVPVHVLSVVNLLPSEKKELSFKLRAELEVVQSFQKKVEFLRINAATLSSSSNILSSSSRRSGPLNENSKAFVNPVSGKKLQPNPSSHNSSGMKRGNAGRFISGKEVSHPFNGIFLKQCSALLKRLMSHRDAALFNAPVDVKKYNIPDYFTIIKHPMDLGTVKENLSAGSYLNPMDFAADVRLTFSNAKTYNPPGNYVHAIADKLSNLFEEKWLDIEKKIEVPDIHPLTTKSSSHSNIQSAKTVPPLKKRKVTSVQSIPVPEPIVERIMTEEEKLKLGGELGDLMEDMPPKIVDFLKEHSSNGRECADDEIEIDIDDLSDEALFALRKLLDEHYHERQMTMEKAEPCEIELLHESGPSSSSLQPGRGCDPVDEDVDIGGNEPPVTSYPPVEIEKDSDSSSSDKEADLETHPIKDSAVGSCKVDEKASEFDGDQSVSGLDQVGDSAPTETQVSPDKLYRAALLRNRFADTILKAQEKTLKQNEKVDPDKLRKEKEKLELQQKKEKARLQAEAKAAEEARRRAEAEAVAEAKRLRDIEREAARQALMQMEKTVEIHVNSQLLEELEMLRTVPGELVPSSVDETSPDLSQDGLGSFKFGGSNPLEQLGLFMKDDEEEDDAEAEHGKRPSASDFVNDVEEGEID